MGEQIQNTQEIKQNACLSGRNRTKRANFRGSPLFQAKYNIKNRRKKEQQLIQLILCQLDARGLAEGKGHETD